MTTIAQHQPAVIVAGRRMSHSASSCKQPKGHDAEHIAPPTTDVAATAPTPTHDGYPRPATNSALSQRDHKIDYAPFEGEEAFKKHYDGKRNAEAAKIKAHPAAEDAQPRKEVRGGRIVQPVRKVDI